MFFKNKKRYVVHTVGDPVLREKAKPVAAVTPEIRQLAASMIESMQAFEGIGLAAPQAGESLRLVVFDVPLESMGDTPSTGERLLLPKMPLVVVNPEIVASSENLTSHDEGCLSLPDLFAPVVRPASVVFRAQTLDGEWIECECGGLLGRCIQHELDHLDGTLFIDRLTPEAARTVERELKQLIRFGERHHFHRVKVK
ncbi:peptide deformylase [uncultured Victivallis sp.]|uniref:peptide deformylase n=1 Tax=uncultured Victivallis sp. TaxID=354118 RepID=UPI0025E16F73|nr:peptide deformylase [uncultured Victivallis sp.]